MTQSQNDIMVSASAALAQLEYSTSESLCLQALGDTRDKGDWANYARILMPLQESRRLKRQAAIDRKILIGTADYEADILETLNQSDAGCIVVTHPHRAADVVALVSKAKELGRAIEVLWADCETQEKTWTLRSASEPAFSTSVTAPNPAWINCWVQGSTRDTVSAAHWFMQAIEALGSAGLETISAEFGTLERITQLEAVLQAAGDHEMLHQALGDAVRAYVAKG